MGKTILLALLGVGLIGFGVYEYYDLMLLETQGGSRKVHSLIKLLYEMGGKWAVAGTLGAVGLGMVVYAVATIGKRRNATQQPA